MSDQDSNITPTEDEDVEAHKKSRLVASASDEAPKDDESPLGVVARVAAALDALPEERRDPALALLASLERVLSQ